MLTFEVFTPNKRKNELKISYGCHPTMFGKCFIGKVNNGICLLSFVDGSEKTAISYLKKEWPEADIKEDTEGTKSLVENIFSDENDVSEKDLNLILKGTEFQIKVWKSLVSIPIGETVSYEEVAKKIGNPKATRAVANAIGGNRIAYLIPCHRVINKSGNIGKYQWGEGDRKKNILNYEAKRKK